MIIPDSIDRSAGWHEPPLCRRYLVVHFEALPLLVKEGGPQSDRTVYWALGAHAEGPCEVLGVWPTLPSGGQDWREVFESLAARGVERIRFVVSAAADAVPATHMGATVLTLDSQQGSSGLAPPGALSPRLRRIVKLAAMEVSVMQAELVRLIRRHGAFPSTVAASDFLQKALARMERRFWTGASARAASARRQSIAVPRAAAV
ncbi:MAG: transposase [Rubrivivax sp.]|nr:transposase [Rubrivivax sp.]MDP3085265.1 transposase [Rubrivivax sp.]